MSDTSYLFHPGDYLRDTVGLTLLEHGAYRLLLDHYYTACGILPVDKPRLYRICGAHEQPEQTAVDTVVDKFFPIKNGKLTNKRADEEIERKRLFSEKQARKGRLGGRPSKKPRVSDPSIVLDLKDLINAFKSLFNKQFNEELNINYAKDTVLLKRLLKTYGKQKTIILMERFFEIEDDFIERSGYTIGVFYSVVNRLLTYQKSRKKACAFPGCRNEGIHVARNGRTTYCGAHISL